MKLESNWQFKTLENLLARRGERFPNRKRRPDPDFHSHVVRRTNELHKVPLNEFSVEDMRIMIGQNFGLPYLVPLAIAKLRENALAEGDFYPGDLLVAITSIDPQFWVDNPNYERDVKEIVADNRALIVENRVKVGKAFLK